MNWPEIIAVAEAALERERATMDMEIEGDASRETTIGGILVEIIEAAKAEDAARIREALETLRLEYAPLADKFMPYVIK